jgi:predicted enzyme related to lactoylglutathione lyase
MTRRGRTSRSVERRLDELETNAAESATRVEVLWRDDRTGELHDRDGDPTEPDSEALVVIFNESVVVSREQAEANGYDILGPAENVPSGREAVRVAEDSIDTA